MNDSADAVMSLVSAAFAGASGPCAFKFAEAGSWFEWEGKDAAKALLNLDPADIEYDDIIRPIDGAFLPAWATDEGLLWLVPGIVRVVFQTDPPCGDRLLQRLFSELLERIHKGHLRLTEAQRACVLEVHEFFYCTESFGWNPDRHLHPLCRSIRARTNS